ncbi:MAG: hypothetical protein J5806_06455 [Lentisphaeria bacterium]|nr:hypothetical protein [Lentisphaeria bacterium]
MTKIVRIPFDDILFDPEEVGGLLTGCQRRRRKMRLAGAGTADDVLIVLFEDSAFAADSEIVLAPFRGQGPDEVAAEIQDRYEHGYTLRSSFRIRKQTWALYEVTAE